jgi:NAD(P)-dependent dehydrogenase (short-subunit alcohol dehydrogenase family)
VKLPPVEPKSVLVTGCSSGIGAATATLLRKRGWKVFPTARNPDDLDQLRKDGFEAIHLDLGDSASVQAAADVALEVMEGNPGALVNNAGYGQPGALEDLSRDAMRAQFEVNVFGMQELTNRFIPVFRKQRAGRIVNVSSVVGRVSLPFSGIYSATKFAMEAMSDAMRVEFSDSGIGVSLVEPGPITTHFRVDRG